MARTISDYVFGTISYKNIWRGETSITFFEKTVNIDLYINGDEDEEISPIQRDSFVSFKENESRIVKEAEDKVYDYYLGVIEDYRAMQLSEELADKNTPRISSVKELAYLVQPISLLIDYDYHDGTRRIGILCDCTWEPEHGVGISIVNEKVSKVGFQDIVL